MKPRLLYTQKSIKNRNRLDKFLTTYMRCFEPKDTQKIIRANNLNKLFVSIAAVPGAALCAFVVPYSVVYPSFNELPYVFQLPGYAAGFLVCSEVFTATGLWWKYRLWNKMYKKYHSQMDLTKEDIERIEAEEAQTPKIE